MDLETACDNIFSRGKTWTLSARTRVRDIYTAAEIPLPSDPRSLALAIF